MDFYGFISAIPVRSSRGSYTIDKTDLFTCGHFFFLITFNSSWGFVASFVCLSFGISKCLFYWKGGQLNETALKCLTVNEASCKQRSALEGASLLFPQSALTVFAVILASVQADFSPPSRVICQMRGTGIGFDVRSIFCLRICVID